jgi:hypothetical protein
MCKPKSEGGRRCSFHLEQGTTAALLSMGARQAGLSRAETERTLEALRREHIGTEAPSREEVDEFLGRAAAVAEVDPFLSEHARRSVVARLRASIGRILPSGATFTAWRRFTAEAWARTRRGIVGVLLASTVMTGVGACGTTEQPASPAASGASATEGQDQGNTVPAISPLTGGDEARAAFGAGVDAGYQTATKVAIETSVQADLLVNENPTPEDFDRLTPYLTPSAAKNFRATVERALAGDTDAQSAVQATSFYNLAAPGWSFPDGQRVVNQQITSPQVGLDRGTGTDRLLMSFHQHADVRMTDHARAVLVPLDKDVRMWMTPAPAGSPTPWLIDGLSATYKVGEATPAGG